MFFHSAGAGFYLHIVLVKNLYGGLKLGRVIRVTHNCSFFELYMYFNEKSSFFPGLLKCNKERGPLFGKEVLLQPHLT